MNPKGVFRHANIPRDINKWKMPTFKFGHFWPKKQDLPLRKNSIFGRNTNILLKASNWIVLSENVPCETFYDSQVTEDKEIAQTRRGQDESSKDISFPGRCLHLKMISKGVFWHSEISRDINKWKIPIVKFGHIWPKTMDLTLRKVRFLDEIRIFF